MRVRDLVQEFEQPDGSTVRILDGITFDVAPGEFVALTGQSGCGKTTLLRLLMGLNSATSGLLEAVGQPIRGCDHRRAMVFQNAELLPLALGHRQCRARPGDQGRGAQGTRADRPPLS